MIVKCLKLFNVNTREYENKSHNGFITVGMLYQVLEVYFRESETLYRIIPDKAGIGGHPTLVRNNEFEMVSGKIPPNWAFIQRRPGPMLAGPEKWIDHQHWQDSFWEDWDNSLPEALRCYEEELKIIKDSDPL